MDTTIIYYTANRITETFAQNVRRHLLWSSGGRRIISVSQKPINFGENIHMEGLKPSFYNVYKQILRGAEQADTKYVACAEDDSLYHPEHFEFKPPDNKFYYNRNVWRCRAKGFWTRRNPLMSQCIAPTELMVATLRIRMERIIEDNPEQYQGGEPGLFEKPAGLPIVGYGQFWTNIPTITIKHTKSLMGLKQANNVRLELPFWGKASDLWKEIVG